MAITKLPFKSGQGFAVMEMRRVFARVTSHKGYFELSTRHFCSLSAETKSS